MKGQEQLLASPTLQQCFAGSMDGWRFCRDVEADSNSARFWWCSAARANHNSPLCQLGNSTQPWTGWSTTDYTRQVQGVIPIDTTLLADLSSQECGFHHNAPHMTNDKTGSPSDSWHRPTLGSQVLHKGECQYGFVWKVSSDFLIYLTIRNISRHYLWSHLLQINQQK